MSQLVGRPVDLEALHARWVALRGSASPGVMDDLYRGLVRRFLRRVRCVDPDALGAAPGGRLYLANHQTAIESVTFALVAPLLGAGPVVALAKAEHATTWLGMLCDLWAAWTGTPHALVLVDRARPASMLQAMRDQGERLAAGGSVLVHVSGTRSRSCREPTTQVAAALLELAVASGVSVVPVRFSGGLPVSPVDARLDFPLGYTGQDLTVGAPLPASELGPMNPSLRRDRVVHALAALADPEEVPNPPAMDLVEAVVDRQSAHRGEAAAVFWSLLRETTRPSSETRLLLEADGRPLTLRPEQQVLARLHPYLTGGAIGFHPPELWV